MSAKEIVDEKKSRDEQPPGARAGGLPPFARGLEFIKQALCLLRRRPKSSGGVDYSMGGASGGIRFFGCELHFSGRPGRRARCRSRSITTVRHRTFGVRDGAAR